MQYTQTELNKILENHKHWLLKDCDGWESMKADFRNADLRNAYLISANLRGADLTGANLAGSPKSEREEDHWSPEFGNDFLGRKKDLIAWAYMDDAYLPSPKLKIELEDK